ncbi:MAG: acyltransferase family protein [Eubacterium sp.]|nr:acyltransferase family protein [Eubacterium sp.]
MPEKKKYFDELNIFRALIIIWVVIGHSTDYVDAYPFSGFMKDYAYSFHMSAFFVISGLLFSKKVTGIKSIKDAGSVVLSRAKRLLIPYFCYSVLSYLLKFFMEKYAFNSLSDHPIKDILLGTNNPNGGIWFLHTLFFLSVLAVILCKVPALITTLVMLAIKIASCFVVIPSFRFPPLMQIYRYGVFFFFGIFFFRYYDRLSYSIKRLFLNKKVLMYPLTVLMCATTFTVFFFIRDELKGNIIIGFLISITHIVVWYLIAVFANCFMVPKKFLMTIGNYGMDIYQIGYYIQTIVRVVFGTILGTPFLFFTFLMFILGLLLPIPISKYFIRKIRPLRMILLGDFSKQKD